jgi:hypothetical protein
MRKIYIQFETDIDCAFNSDKKVEVLQNTTGSACYPVRPPTVIFKELIFSTVITLIIDDIAIIKA